MWEKYTVCGPRYSPHPAYRYSPCSVKLLHTVSKHWKHLVAIKRCAVLMKQHISNILVSMFKIGKKHVALSIKIIYTLRCIKFIQCSVQYVSYHDQMLALNRWEFISQGL